MGENLRHGRGSLLRRDLVFEVAHQEKIRAQAQDAGHPEQESRTKPSRQDGPDDDSHRERYANGDAQHRHGSGAPLGLNVIGHGGKGYGDNRSAALHQPPKNQFPNLPGMRKQRRQGAQERSHAEERHAHHQHLAAADAVRQSAHGNLQDRHGQRVGAKSKAHQELRGSELESVKGENGQNQEQAQHAHPHHAGEGEEHLLLR